MCLIARTSSSKSQTRWPLSLPLGKNLSQWDSLSVLQSSAGFPRGLALKNPVLQESWVWPLCGEDAQRRSWQLVSVFWESCGRGVWRATVNGAAKNRTRLSDSTHIVLSTCPKNWNSQLSHRTFLFQFMIKATDIPYMLTFTYTYWNKQMKVSLLNFESLLITVFLISRVLVTRVTIHSLKITEVNIKSNKLYM